MTEETLNRAIDIKKKIDKLRDRKNELVRQQSLCRGNTSEIIARKYQITIVDRDNASSIYISAGAAEKALDDEIWITDNLLKNQMDDLRDL